MKVVILQSNYMPWRGYFDLIKDADIFCFYDEVKYTKNDWRNRNKIYTKNGLQWLTIPIDKNAVKQKISEVQLPLGWRQQHYDTLKIAYGRAPHFNQLESLLNECYLQNDFTFLSEFNQYSIKKISSRLGIKTEFVNSASYSLEGDRIERLVGLLKKIGATEYISGPAAKDYLDGMEHLFSDNKIKLTYKKYGPYAEYKQLQEPFEPYVSILDLLANVAYPDIMESYL